ncbi:MAG: DJ-1/PfpI family protein [Planctomycetes bacterium]|nr:DJ-1/PfpI family protein [Planctomycetota bacterium]
MSVKILVPLAPGFEEIEAVAIIDVLRRAELEVVTASLTPGAVEGAHEIRVEPDAWLDELELDSFDAIVLPGGMPGTRALMADERVLGLVKELALAGKVTAAVCAAPLVLAAAGVITGREVTSHPAVREELGAADGEVVGDPRVIESGAVITSQGPGTSIEFALALVARFASPEVAERLRAAMLVHAPPLR